MSQCEENWHVLRYWEYIPTKLNQPVTQEKNADSLWFGASIAAQKYGPPLVGCADVISAIPKPTKVVKKLTMSHPTDMTAGPPVVRP
jgi:hypothetical protein